MQGGLVSRASCQKKVLTHNSKLKGRLYYIRNTIFH